MRLRSSSEIARSSTRKSSTAPKTALEQRLGNRRQFDKTPVRPEHAVGGKHVHVRMKVHQVADGSEPP